jgi:acetylglutamate kinase
MTDMEQLTVVKIGGNVIDDPEALTKFLEEIATVNGHKILVHGGGKIASQLMVKLGMQPAVTDGRRITDKDTLEVITMVYAGLVNKQIVAQLQANGCNALGLSGADGNCVTATKRKPAGIDYGYVGDISAQDVRTGLFAQLFAQGIMPVVCPVMHDGDGQLLNTNADTIAAVLATAFSEQYSVSLHYCFEQRGVLSDPHDPKSYLRELSSQTFTELKHSGAVSAGMLPKLQNALDAARNGVTRVRIGHAGYITHMINDEYDAATTITA